MLDLAQVRRDLDSPIYGAMSHVVDVLMRLTHASEAVAVMRDPANGQETVYVAGRLETTRYNTLRKWPCDPRSLCWHARDITPTDVARLLVPQDPAYEALCREIARELAAPQVCEDDMCLTLKLSCNPACRILFVRLAPRPPFKDRDTQSVMRFAAQASHILQQSFNRSRHIPGGTGSTLQINRRPVDIRQLLNQLSSTEHRVLQRLRLNETERQVAQSLGRSPNTVHVHVKNIYLKLHVTSRKQLLRLVAKEPAPSDMPISDAPNPLARPA